MHIGGVSERIHAPDFTGASAWLNTDRPLSIRELRGQLVLLDFWTYCCINCMHVLPVLRDLEERHRDDPLVVIGVHSAKFDAEKDAQHVLAAMRRYGVAHPVAVDSEMRIWSAYAIRSWPTLVVIRPDGTLASVAPGEPDPAILEAFVRQQLEEARAKGTLAQAPLHAERAAPDPSRPLHYPGKVASGGERIFVADSGHHRVLVLDGNGAVRDVIGSGLRGFREGSFGDCAFDDPQGIAVQDGALFIADARAHVIARADLRERKLARIAGTAEPGRAPILERTRALETALRSPWDVAVRGNELYVALAGSHQVALIREGFIEPVIGNGREAQIDGQGVDAAMAQPSGLSLQGDVLYVADSESSGVRAIDLRTRKAYSLCGGPGLFDFGDRLGPIEPGMLQHPLAVAATRSSGLLVADTYNDKIKRFSPDGLRLESFHEGGLEQPAGLCVLPDGQVLVADTNHHRLVLVSADGAQARDLPVAGAPEPQRGVALAAQAPAPASGAGWFTAILAAPAGVGLAPGAGKILFEVSAPGGFELSRGAPWSAALEVSRRSDLLDVTPEFQRGESHGGASEIVEIHAQATHAADVDSELIVTLRSVACDARDHAACRPVQNSFRVPLRLLRDGQREVRFTLPLELSE
jgi:thiol-disulfide isomerase/thioredoxin